MVSAVKKEESVLYGLVLVGGRSSRMKKDKSKLKYHGRPQFEYCFDLLSPFCSKVYLSNRKDQPAPKKFDQIHDLKEFEGIGPLAGILSAMHKFPKTAWIVLGCDLPFVTSKTLKNLLSKRDRKKVATAYKSTYDQLPEPLCAVYEPSARKNSLKFFNKGITCPRKIMINSNVKLLKPIDKHSLDNINDPKEYKSAVAQLKKSRRP